MGAVDMDRARIEHGHAQAKAESAAVERIGERYGTVSFKQGHRIGFWDGFERGAESAQAGAAPNHAAEARAVLQLAGRDVSENMVLQTGEHKADMIAVAQVHATLALVEQQRIANLIALGMYTNADGSRLAQYAVARPSSEYDVALNSEIREGLGL